MKSLTKTFLALALALASAAATAQSQCRLAPASGKTFVASPAAEQALALALAGPDGEYAAYAEYAAILEKFGSVQPYATILQAEERHVAALKRQFEKLGLAVPENPYLGKVQAPTSLKAAAEAGVEAEKRNVAMYDQLLALVKDQGGLAQTFTHLQTASRDCHLPALLAAVANDGQLAAQSLGCGGGCGVGKGQGQGWRGGQGCRANGTNCVAMTSVCGMRGGPGCRFGAAGQ
jgi:hypothetical protein